MKSYNMMLRMLIYVILITVGFFGGFRCLAELINPCLASFGFNGKQVIYIIVFISSLAVFYPIWNDGMRNLRKADINEVSSELLVIAVFGVVMAAILNCSANQAGIHAENDAFLPDTIFVSVIFSPIIEEFYCRGAVIYLFKNAFHAVDSVCILASALIFALFHYKSLSNGDVKYIICYFLIYFILGIGCAYLYLKTNNILSPVILHMIWNLSTVGGSIIANTK